MKKIVIIGPESTGKTTLSRQLAEHFQCPMVEEYARTYIAELTRVYRQSDLLAIAHGQLRNEDSIQEIVAKWLFCDTDLRVIKIWSHFKFGKVDPWILEQIKKRVYHSYLLMDIDLPWEPDPQREHPHSRQELFERYHNELMSSGVPFHIISGAKQERLKNALKYLSAIG